MHPSRTVERSDQTEESLSVVHRSSKEDATPPNSEADTPIIAPAETSARKPICKRPNRRNEPRPPAYPFRYSRCQRARDKTNRSAPYRAGAPRQSCPKFRPPPLPDIQTRCQPDRPPRPEKRPGKHLSAAGDALSTYPPHTPQAKNDRTMRIFSPNSGYPQMLRSSRSGTPRIFASRVAPSHATAQVAGTGRRKAANPVARSGLPAPRRPGIATLAWSEQRALRHPRRACGALYRIAPARHGRPAKTGALP